MDFDNLCDMTSISPSSNTVTETTEAESTSKADGEGTMVPNNALSTMNGVDDADSQSWTEPAWLTEKRDLGSIAEEWGESLQVPEWSDNDNYRDENGWQGRDLVHDEHSPVRVVEYFVKYGTGQGLPDALFKNNENDRQGGVGTILTGISRFTRRAESHQGFCHGGSMCSLLDDVIGWCGFVATGKCLPWSGFTVQINTQLKKPIKVGSTLIVQAEVTRIERRKVFVKAQIVDFNQKEIDSSTGNDKDNSASTDDSQWESVVHASGDGLVVLNRGVLPELATRGSLHSWPSSVPIS